jgi:hypothetical protein
LALDAAAAALLPAAAAVPVPVPPIQRASCMPSRVILYVALSVARNSPSVWGVSSDPAPLAQVDSP